MCACDQPGRVKVKPVPADVIHMKARILSTALAGVDLADTGITTVVRPHGVAKAHTPKMKEATA